MTPPSFHHLVDEYLTARRGLGFGLETDEWFLRDFASRADRSGHSGPVTIELAVQWARSSSRSSNPAQAARRLAIVRQFARYRALFDPTTEVPPVGLLGRIPTRRSTPHIYTEAEMAALLQQARCLLPRHGLRPATYVAYFALLVSTGLRLSEACRLTTDDTDLVNCASHPCCPSRDASSRFPSSASTGPSSATCPATRSRRSSPRPTGPPGAASATPSSSPSSTTPALASPRSPVCTSPMCFSTERPRCFCTARDARSVSSRSGRAPQRNCGGGSPESMETPTPPCFPIARASPCRAPGSNINCASPAERPRSVTHRSRRGGSRPTRCDTRPRCICSSPESTSPSSPSGSATRTPPPPTSTSKPTSP